MNIQQINKSDAESVFVVVKNVDGTGTMTTGLGVALVAAGASLDGISAVQQVASTYSKAFAGIAKQDIPVNGYGLVVAWGLANSVAISANVASSITITAGDQLWPSAVAGEFYSSAAKDTVNLSTLAVSALATNKGYVMAVDTVGLSTGTIKYVRGLVRAL
jgi:hypothetical protein